MGKRAAMCNLKDHRAWIVGPLLAALGLVSLLTIAPPLYAQNPGNNPSVGHDAAGERRTVIVSLEKVNAARRAAGLVEIDPEAPFLPEPGKITITVEIPAPKTRGLLPTRREVLAGPWAALVPSAAAQASRRTTPSPLIAGLDFDDNDSLAGGFVFIPPDPHGTVGLNHVCHVANVAIECHTKAGVLVFGYPMSLEDFFAPLTPLTFTFDPKILYDHVTDRFVVVTLEQTQRPADPANTSRILLAVSDDGTPDPPSLGGVWHFQAIDASEQGPAAWFDYPGFAVDEDAVYVSGNMFSFGSGLFSGTRLWIVDKGLGTSGLYDGGTSAATSYDPFAETGESGLASTLQPALMFGEPPAPPAASHKTSATEVGTFLVEYSGLSDGADEFLYVIRVDDPLALPVFTGSLVVLGDIEDFSTGMPDAPQLDDGAGPPDPEPIETNDRRALDAIWRNDALWMTTQIVPPMGDPNANQATAHWAEVSTDTLGTPVLTQQGDIGGEEIAPATHTFYPSVAVNAAGDVAFGFSASAATIFAGAYATGRFAVDAPGTTAPPSTLAAGEASYLRKFGGTLNRWGDYTGTVVDPVDGSFWVINEAAGARGTPTSGGQDGRWEVYLGRFGTALLPVELVVFEAVADGEAVRLTWETASETNNAGFEVQHIQIGVYEALGLVEGHGTTTVPQHYRYQVDNLMPGQHYFRLKQLDFDGSFEYSPVVGVLTEVAGVFALSGAYPNPFNPATAFDLVVLREQRVRVEVIDMLGRQVGLLFNGLVLANDTRSFRFHPSNLPSGLYFFRITGETFTASRSALLLR